MSLKHPDTLQRRREEAIISLLSDRSMQRYLTDPQLGELLDLALHHSDSAIAMTANLDDEVAAPAMNRVVESIRRALQLAEVAVVAHVEGRTEDCQDALTSLGVHWADIAYPDNAHSNAGIRERLRILLDFWRVDASWSGALLASYIAMNIGAPIAEQTLGIGSGVLS